MPKPCPPYIQDLGGTERNRLRSVRVAGFVPGSKRRQSQLSRQSKKSTGTEKAEEVPFGARTIGLPKRGGIVLAALGMV